MADKHGHSVDLIFDVFFGLSPPAPISVTSPRVYATQLFGLIPSNGAKSMNHALKSVAVCCCKLSFS